MSTVIIPAILEKTMSSVENKMKRVSGITSEIQIDICDGRFVATRTYASSGRTASVHNIVSTARRHKLSVELDLMIDLDCGDCMDRWVLALVKAKPRRVTFHLGSTYRWKELFDRLTEQSKSRDLPFEIGLAVRIDHTRQEIAKVYNEYPFSYIQVMGIERVGTSGQKLSPKIFSQITKINRAYPRTTIAVDGGVKLDNAEELFRAGADRLGVNSGIFSHKNIPRIIQEFTNKYVIINS